VLSRVEAARPKWIPATVLLLEIREQGYPGGISQLKAYLALLKRQEPEPLVRFETALALESAVPPSHSD
jgi:transposase